MPLFGPPKIEKLKAKRDVAGLAKALWYKTETIGGPAWAEEVRRAAASALATLGEPEALEPLLTVFRDHYFQTQSPTREVRDALREVRDPACIDRLFELLSDEGEGLEERVMRCDVADALGHLEDERAVHALTFLLRHGDEEERKAAVEMLHRLNDPGAILPLAQAALNDRIPPTTPMRRPARR